MPEKASVRIRHIDNNVYHLGLESSEVFLKKTDESLIGLKCLMDRELLREDYLRIMVSSANLRKLGLRKMAALLFKILRKPLRKNLLGSNPSLFIYDLYRLGYICSLK